MKKKSFKAITMNNDITFQVEKTEFCECGQARGKDTLFAGQVINIYLVCHGNSVSLLVCKCLLLATSNSVKDLYVYPLRCKTVLSTTITTSNRGISFKIMMVMPPVES